MYDLNSPYLGDDFFPPPRGVKGVFAVLDEGVVGLGGAVGGRGFSFFERPGYLLLPDRSSLHPLPLHHEVRRQLHRVLQSPLPIHVREFVKETFYP